MDLFLDVLTDTAIDTVKLIPFLFLTYWAMEALERHAGDKTARAIEEAGHAGPIIGGVLGALPQCGFSAAASTLYAGRVVTLGTLIAVFLSTSDEMLPIFIAEQVSPVLIAQIIGIKVVVGIVMGFAVDGVLRAAHRQGDGEHIHELCERDHCSCDEEDAPAWRSALVHTLEVTVFIFLVGFVIGGAIELVGEDTVAGWMQGSPVLSIIISAIIGLIPNCGASVVLTELYLDGTLAFPAAMAGLLVSAGIGLLVLMRTNRHAGQNVRIILLLLATGIVWGLIFQVAGVQL